MPFDVLDPSLAQPAPITSAGAPLNSDDVDGSISFLSMLDDIALLLGGRADISAGGSRRASLKRWTNYGYRWLSGILDVKELWADVEFTLIADQHLYMAPSTLAWIKKMSLDDGTDYWEQGGREMEQIDIDTYRMLPNSDEIQTDGSSFPPTKYFRYGRMIVVYPTPVTEYSAPVDFRVRVADMVEDTDCPLFGQEFHEAVLFAGAMRAAKMLGLRARALELQNDMAAVLKPLINTDGEERVAMHMVAQPIHRKIQLYMGG